LWAYAVIFGGLLTWYLPRELDRQKTEIINETKVAIGKVLIPALDRISLPDDKIKAVTTDELENRFQQTSGLIDGALSGTIPTDPGGLSTIKKFLRTSLKERNDLPSLARAAGDSALIHIYGYEQFSESFLGHKSPQYRLINVKISQFGTPIRVEPDAMGRVVVYGSTIADSGSQALDGVKWINTTLSHLKVTYGGGDLFLADVLFKDCTFELGDTSQGKALLLKLQASQGQSTPATILFSKEDQGLGNLYALLEKSATHY
jgi:hypothetical protein